MTEVRNVLADSVVMAEHRPMIVVSDDESRYRSWPGPDEILSTAKHFRSPRRWKSLAETFTIGFHVACHPLRPLPEPAPRSQIDLNLRTLKEMGLRN